MRNNLITYALFTRSITSGSGAAIYAADKGLAQCGIERCVINGCPPDKATDHPLQAGPIRVTP